MLVSVIITNYNQAKFVEPAIKSIASQNYPENSIELIIVDDGSTDNSREEIVKAAEKFGQESNPIKRDLRVLFKENGGTASARNTGFRAASSDIIAYLDVDDQYLPNKIKRSVEELTRYKHVGVVYSDYYETINGQRKKVYKPNFHGEMLLQNCFVSTNSVIHRRVFDLIGEFDERIECCEDYDFWVRTFNAGLMIRHIPEFLFVYNNHGGNKTANPTLLSKWSKEEEFVRTKVLAGEYFVDNR